MRFPASLSALVALPLVGVVSVAGCSAAHDPAPGEILLAIGTNLKVPDDIDEVGISVTTADGRVSEDQMWMVAPAGTARFPATLAIVRGTDRPVDIRAVGYKKGTALALREAVTTIPGDRTALLHLDLNWLDKGSVEGTSATPVHTLDSLSCAAGQTSVAGTCQTFTLDSASLADFSRAAIAPTDDTTDCVNVDQCLGGSGAVSYSLPLESSDCSVAAPAASATGLNVGLRLRPGSDGWCDATGCTIPLAMDPAEGWTLAGGRVQLPPAVCTNAKIVAVTVSGSSASCPAQTTQHPACQSYGGDGGVAPVVDAGVPDASVVDAGDAEVPDAAPSPTTSSFKPATPILAFAVDARFVYMLTQGASANLSVFPRGSGAFSVPYVYTIPVDGADAAAISYAMAASFPALVVLTTDNQPEGNGAINIYDVTDPVTTSGGPTRILSLGAPFSPTLTAGPGAAAGTARVIVSGYGISGDVEEIDVPSAVQNGDAYNSILASYDRTGDAYAFGAATGGSTYGPYPADGQVDDLALNPAANFGNVSNVVFPGGSVFAAIQGAGTAVQVGRVTGATASISVGNTGSSAQPSRLLGGTASGRVVWIDAAGQMETVPLPGDGALPASSDGGLVIDAGTGASTPATQVALDGTDLYWTDGTTLWHRDVNTLPGVTP